MEPQPAIKFADAQNVPRGGIARYSLAGPIHLFEAIAEILQSSIAALDVRYWGKSGHDLLDMCSAQADVR